MYSVRVVDVIPEKYSNEGNENYEPSIAVNPANPKEILIAAAGVDHWRLFHSFDAGENWELDFELPERPFAQSLAFGGQGDIYRVVANEHATISVLRISDSPDTLLNAVDLRKKVDQPWLHLFNQKEGSNWLYVTYNDWVEAGELAVVDVIPNAFAPQATSTHVRLDPRVEKKLYKRDGYEIRPTTHPTGRVYVAYKGWTNASTDTRVIADVLVARDDDWGRGGFKALLDPNDNLAGCKAVTGVLIKDSERAGHLGGQRVANDLDIAVDPNNSDNVYIVWGDNQGIDSGYILHVRSSRDGGKTWSEDLFAVESADLARLAISCDSVIGLMYQQLIQDNQGFWEWETHLRRSSDGISWESDLVLGRTATKAGFLGDFAGLVSVGKNFYGVFPAVNTPDPANFPATPATESTPNGARFLRKVTKTEPWNLIGDNGQNVDNSVDPFFFSINKTR
jgi:hypothetical protein